MRRVQVYCFFLPKLRNWIKPVKSNQTEIKYLVCIISKSKYSVSFQNKMSNQTQFCSIWRERQRDDSEVERWALVVEIEVRETDTEQQIEEPKLGKKLDSFFKFPDVGGKCARQLSNLFFLVCFLSSYSQNTLVGDRKFPHFHPTSASCELN